LKEIVKARPEEVAGEREGREMERMKGRRR
jgi:hypothetical protein